MAAIFGVHHLKAVVLIMVSAAAGAVLRRTLARYSANTLLQPLCAALLAGMIGALAVRYNLSSSLRLVAVCPCMILVPGPHVLNGAMDLIAARINLGASRPVLAGLIILAISVGLLLGMAILSVSLPVGEPGRAVPLWLDVIAAGVAIAAFSVFFSTPLRMLGCRLHSVERTRQAQLESLSRRRAFLACHMAGHSREKLERRGASSGSHVCRRRHGRKEVRPRGMGGALEERADSR